MCRCYLLPYPPQTIQSFKCKPLHLLEIMRPTSNVAQTLNILSSPRQNSIFSCGNISAICHIPSLTISLDGILINYLRSETLKKLR